MNQTRLLLIVAFFTFLGVNAIAQDFPANAKPGTCYAKCYIADQWETKTERILVKEASNRKEAYAAKFETKTERVLAKEASQKIRVIPAKYETKTEQVLVKEASKTIRTIPAKYETKTERILVEEATTKWVKQRDAMCASENSDDCMVWCLIEVPALYNTVTKRMLVEDAKTTETEIPAKYATVSKRVLVEAAKTVTDEIPAEYKNVTKRVRVEPAGFRTIEVPAEYRTVTKKVLVKKGGFTELKEVVCAKYITNELIRQVQRALISKGYDVGPARDDNILGPDTRVALKKYQTDNSLPVGNLNKDTMKHLGIAEKYYN